MVLLVSVCKHATWTVFINGVHILVWLPSDFQNCLLCAKLDAGKVLQGAIVPDIDDKFDVSFSSVHKKIVKER